QFGALHVDLRESGNTEFVNKAIESDARDTQLANGDDFAESTALFGSNNPFLLQRRDCINFEFSETSRRFIITCSGTDDGDLGLAFEHPAKRPITLRERFDRYDTSTHASENTGSITNVGA